MTTLTMRYKGLISYFLPLWMLQSDYGLSPHYSLANKWQWLGGFLLLLLLCMFYSWNITQNQFKLHQHFSLSLMRQMGQDYIGPECNVYVALLPSLHPWPGILCKVVTQKPPSSYFWTIIIITRMAVGTFLTALASRYNRVEVPPLVTDHLCANSTFLQNSPLC